MVLGLNDKFELLSSSPSNNEAFGYAGIAQRVGCTEAT
jgi:hypothetical protein